MTSNRHAEWSAGRIFLLAMSGALVGLVGLPALALIWGTSLPDLLATAHHHTFAPALMLSAATTACTVFVAVVLGTPLSWQLARSQRKSVRWLSALLELPILLPPAVIGVALLQAFGRKGLLGPILTGLGLQIPFTPAAVVLAQTVVAAPFYIRSATSAFAALDPEILLVARCLGASKTAVFWRVAVPMAAPGLVVGASVCGARALGEFGATLLFAGNMLGRTQTMPLAIFDALETDVGLATAFSVVLASAGILMLWITRRFAARLAAQAGGET